MAPFSPVSANGDSAVRVTSPSAVPETSRLATITLFSVMYLVSVMVRVPSALVNTVVK